jgi:hypothetical protein
MQNNFSKSNFSIAASMLSGALGITLLMLPEPAIAQTESCPAPWLETSGGQAPGYRMCSRYIAFGTQVQIVDLKAGARVVIRSQIATPAVSSIARYVTRTAADWWNYTLNYTTSPTGGKLQAVVNASFFMTKDVSTELSFGQKKDGVTETMGADPEIVYGKRYLGFFGGGAKALIQDFNYKGRDAAAYANALSSVNSALVSFTPDGGPVASASTRRTYVGGRDTDADGALDRLYILASIENLTSADAIKILRDEFKTSANIQFDGGGSTQLYSLSGQSTSTDCLRPDVRSCRKVPNVLAIYAAP